MCRKREGNSAGDRRARFGIRLLTRGAAVRLGILVLLVLLSLPVCYFIMIWMPGKSYRGPLPESTEPLKTLQDELRHDVQMIAGEIGERNVHRPDRLAMAANWLEAELGAAGYDVTRQTYEVYGVECANLIAERPGRDPDAPILIVGAHYDTVPGSPGANDNGSGIAATLALARRFADADPLRTVRFVLFVNEEPPFFQTEDMGSLVYARMIRARGDELLGMISLETIGYYSEEKGSQSYPLGPLGLVYPTRGDFIAFVGNVKSRRFLREVVGSFRSHAKIPSEGGAIPGGIPGVGWSDHWAFWQAGYPAIMVTDTAPFRYPHYHLPSDTPDKLDYRRFAVLVDGLTHVIADLAGVDTQ